MENKMVPADEVIRLINKAEDEGFIYGDIDWLRDGISWLMNKTEGEEE